MKFLYGHIPKRNIIILVVLLVLIGLGTSLYSDLFEVYAKMDNVGDFCIPNFFSR